MKDAQVALATHPTKKIKLTILVANIMAGCGMILSIFFYREMGGDIKMHWSCAIIPVGNKKIKLEPKEKEKFIVLEFDDPKVQILYQEMEFKNYTMFFDFNLSEEQPEPPSDSKIWTLEFDGACIPRWRCNPTCIQRSIQKYQKNNRV